MQLDLMTPIRNDAVQLVLGAIYDARIQDQLQPDGPIFINFRAAPTLMTLILRSRLEHMAYELVS